jgi:hypothetical protein
MIAETQRVLRLSTTAHAVLNLENCHPRQPGGLPGLRAELRVVQAVDVIEGLGNQRVLRRTPILGQGLISPHLCRPTEHKPVDMSGVPAELPATGSERVRAGSERVRLITSVNAINSRPIQEREAPNPTSGVCLEN